MNDSKSILKINKISKKFGNRRVVQQASFQVESGQVVGLLGPNGAGKTTCFYMVVGLVKLDEGEILLNNLNITNYAMYKRARSGLSYLAQEPSIFRKLTVEENLLVALEAHDLSSQDRRERLELLLQDFNIDYLRNSYGYALSGGERRRVEIARALAGNPHFLLLDEPFAGIDPISVVDIKRIITHLSKSSIGVLITDHNVRETLDICQRAYILSEGRSIAHGTPQDIMNNKKVRDVYLGEEFHI